MSSDTIEHHYWAPQVCDFGATEAVSAVPVDHWLYHGSCL